MMPEIAKMHTCGLQETVLHYLSDRSRNSEEAYETICHLIALEKKWDTGQRLEF